MTREIIEDFRFIVIPYMVNRFKEINYEGQGGSDAKEFMSNFNEICDLAIKALEQEQRWIPCSERLPENDGFYLVTEKSGRVCIYVFHKEGNSEEYWKRCTVAWMQLPQSYGEVEQESVLDKIRTEIKQLVSRYTISRERVNMGQVEWEDRLIREADILQIIDKYKAETEET